MVQRRGARFVTNMYRYTTSVGGLLEKLDWSRLSDRRKYIRLCMLYKIKNELVAIPFENKLLPPLRKSRSINENSFQLPYCRVDYRKQSFFPRTIADWNCLDPSISSATTLELFKSNLKSAMTI